MVAVTMLVGCTDRAALEAPADAAPARTAVLAPIESAEIVVRESFPPQYALLVVSGLPSGCARFERIDVAHAANAIAVTVWNTVPADRATPCTMIYGTAQNTVNLDRSFTSGETFIVNVNGTESLRFVAQ